MAPKKGGSSSSSSSGSSGSSSSSSSGNRSGGSSTRRPFVSSDGCLSLTGDTGSLYIGIFVIQGLCFIIITLTALLWLFFSLRKRKTAPSPVQRVLRFYSYAVLLVLLLLSILLTITEAALSVCFVSTSYTYRSLFVAYNILGGVTELILLALVSLVFLRYLLKTKARSTGLATIINSVIFGIVAALWLPDYVLYSYITIHRPTRYSLRSSTYKLTGAYYFLYFVAAVTASVFNLSAVLPSSVPAFNVRCKIFTLFTLLMFCIYPFVAFIRFAAYYAAGRPLSVGGELAFQVFMSFSFVFAVLGLLLAVHTAKPGGGVAPAANTTGKVYAYEAPPQHSTQSPVHQHQQQQAYHQPQPQQQPIYPNQGVYNQGGGMGGSSMVFYNPPQASQPHR